MDGTESSHLGSEYMSSRLPPPSIPQIDDRTADLSNKLSRTLSQKILHAWCVSVNNVR